MLRGPTERSLQDLIDSKLDLVDYFYNDTQAPHFARVGSAAAAYIPAVYTNWRDEQRAWSETPSCSIRAITCPSCSSRATMR